MNQYILVEIGQKLRKIRKEKGLTVQTVAVRAGVSKGLISRIENSRTVPSLPVLISIIKSLEVGINSFFGDIDRGALEHVIVKKATDLKTSNPNPSDALLHYPIIDKNVPESFLKTSVLEIKPAAKGLNQSTSGFTFQYILEGQIEYQISGETYELTTGDSIYFDAKKIHSFENTSDVVAKLLVADFIV